MKKTVLSALVVTAAWLSFGTPAQAQYSVYVLNTARNDGWVRAGHTGQVNVSYQACLNAINQRIADNRRYGQDFEAFGISAGTAPRVNAPSYVVYRPSTQPPRRQILWYCDVSLVQNGRTYTGYLGGYTSESAARQAYTQWARGVANLHPHLIRVRHD